MGKITATLKLAPHTQLPLATVTGVRLARAANAQNRERPPRPSTRPPMNTSHRYADREALQRAARILLRDGHTSEASALNAFIEREYPKPIAASTSHVDARCCFDRCPMPARCRPGCLQHPDQLPFVAGVAP